MLEIFTWAVAVIVVLGMLGRPWGSREWMWAVGGAVLLLATHAIAPLQAWHAVLRGANVYAFLVGILALAAAARHSGLFARLAVFAARASRGSRRRLFVLVYASGVLVTAFLSNDTAAVVLAPAVLAVLAPAGIEPLPYLLACAFAANAASLLFPFSNPANILVYDGRLPSLTAWLHTFGAAALAAVLVTFVVLWLTARGSLHASDFQVDAQLAPADRRTRMAVAAVLAVVVAMLLATALRASLGPITLVASGLAIAALTLADRGALSATVRGVAWQVVPLVAGLFVVVDALGHAGALASGHALLLRTHDLAWPLGELAAAGAVALAANIFNNLPVALAAGYGSHFSPHTLATALVGIDIGPNLSVTGSLSTLLWIIVLRKDGIAVGARSFLRVGWMVALPALLLAALLVR